MTGVDQFLSHAFVLELGWFLLHVVWQGTLIALALSGLLALIDERSATIRYGLSTLALALMLVLPVTTAFGPASMTNALTTTGSLPAAETTAVMASGLAPSGGAPSLMDQAMRLLSASAPWLVPFWLLGVCILTIRTFGAWWVAHQLTRTGVMEVPASIYRSFMEMKRRFGVHGEVIIRQSTRAEVPAVIGYFRPVLLLPVSALSGMSPQQLEAVIAHELAHIRRQDYLVNVFQQFAEILLFFHPAVWWVSGQIRKERENCCDDLAVLACGDVLGYATALLNLEEQRGRAPQLAVAATGGSLVGRVRRLLGKSEWQPGTRTVMVPLVLASISFAVVTLSAQQPGTPAAASPAPSPAASQTAPAPEATPAPQPRETTPPPANELLALFDDAATDRETRQEIISRMSGSPAPEIWAKLLSIAESDRDPEVRKTAISYISGRRDMATLSKLYDKAQQREMKLNLLSYIHGMMTDESMAKIRAIAKSEPDKVVRFKAIDYLSGR
jgi:beta-lactamase regulating signal transducer with metallopeptidase domain